MKAAGILSETKEKQSLHVIAKIASGMNSPGKGNDSEVDDGGNRAEGPGQGWARPHQVK